MNSLWLVIRFNFIGLHFISAKFQSLANNIMHTMLLEMFRWLLTLWTERFWLLRKDSGIFSVHSLIFFSVPDLCLFISFPISRHIPTTYVCFCRSKNFYDWLAYNFFVPVTDFVSANRYVHCAIFLCWRHGNETQTSNT